MDSAPQVAPSEEVTAEQRFAGRAGALLLLLSLLVGGYVASAMTGRAPGDARMILGAHITGLIGALFLFGFAWSLPLLRLTTKLRRSALWAFIVGNFANLIIGTAKAFPGVHGVGMTDDTVNNVVFGLLNVFVVLPLLFTAGLWVYGFRK